jgi:hypothetical protein
MQPVESHEAQKKFSNAKSISSAQYFGNSNKDGDSENSGRLQKFAVSYLCDLCAYLMMVVKSSGGIIQFGNAEQSALRAQLEFMMLGNEVVLTHPNLVFVNVQNSSAISSADYFDRDEESIFGGSMDITASEIMSKLSMQVTDSSHYGQVITNFGSVAFSKDFL